MTDSYRSSYWVGVAHDMIKTFERDDFFSGYEGLNPHGLMRAKWIGDAIALAREVVRKDEESTDPADVRRVSLERVSEVKAFAPTDTDKPPYFPPF